MQAVSPVSPYLQIVVGGNVVSQIDFENLFDWTTYHEATFTALSPQTTVEILAGQGSSTCLSFVIDDVSAVGCPPPIPPPFLFGSCREILNNNPSTPSGWFEINTTTSTVVEVYCDMTADSSAAYTVYPCTNCISVSTTTERNSCTDLGLQMLVPRSENHWAVLYNLLSSLLIPPSESNYFQVVPGVSKPTDGLTPCLGASPPEMYADSGPGIMNSGYCSPVSGAWTAIDNGTWWIRDSEISEPSGDYLANCLLGLQQFGGGTVPSNIIFNDASCNYFSGGEYFCSTNDDSYVAPQTPPFPPPPSV